MKLTLLLAFSFIFIVSTALFYLFTHQLGFDSGYVGAYVNLLVFDATLFAAITAYLLVDSWKKQHNASKISDYAESAWKALSRENTSIYSVKYAFERDSFDGTFLRSKTYSNFEKMYLDMRGNSTDILLCLELQNNEYGIKNRNGQIDFLIRNLQSKFIVCFKDDKRQQAKNTIIEILEAQINHNEELKNYFRSLIILNEN